MNNEENNMSLDFVVDDVFSFQDRRTVFAGRLLGESSYVKPCRADVVIEGVVKCSVLLEEEMMPLNREDRSVRGLSTLDQISIDLKRIPKGGIILRLHECEPPKENKETCNVT